MKTRLISFAVGFIFLFLILAVFYVQIIQGEKFRTLSKKNSIRLFPQHGARGRILDRKGLPIVDNYLSYDLMILSPRAERLQEILSKIAKVLEVSPGSLSESYRRNYIAPSIPVELARNIAKEKAIALEELKFDLSGIVIQPRPARHYPYGWTACHLIGYLNEIDRWRLTKLADYGYKTKDIMGFGGIEEKYDYYLRPQEGGLSIEVDHLGRAVRILGFRPPRDGKDVQLTVDLGIQIITEEALAEARGCVVILDANSAEIISLASRPAFDPDIFLHQASSSIRGVFNDPAAPLVNRAISGLYPAGSIFKVVVCTAALETGKINLGTTFLCSGKTHVGKQEFLCWNTHQYQNLIAAITHSCNVFFYKTGILLGVQLIHNYALRFGFSKLTYVDLPYETKGIVPSPLRNRIYKFRGWYDGDTANFSIGQGDLLVSPLQVARMMAVFANAGKLVFPYITKAIGAQEFSLEQRKGVSLGLREETLQYIRRGLRSAVSQAEGTAHVLSEVGVSVAGKTGTAQVGRGQPHGCFVGFFPFQNPRFVICVFLEHGGSGQAACIVAKRIIEGMLKEGYI